MIQNMVEQKDLTEAELSSTLYLSINKNLKFLAHLTKTPLSSKNLASPYIYQLTNGVAFIIFGRIQTGSSKSEPPNPIHFEYKPLSVFDLVHFNIYDAENYRAYSRGFRAGLAAGDKTLDRSSSRQELREKAQLFNSSKWTKQAIQMASSWERNAGKTFSDPNVNMAGSMSGSIPRKFSVSPMSPFGRSIKSTFYSSTPSSTTSTTSHDRLPSLQRQSSVRENPDAK